jgi:hypothetical protein
MGRNSTGIFFPLLALSLPDTTIHSPPLTMHKHHGTSSGYIRISQQVLALSQRKA